MFRVSVPMIKSYESGKASPSELFIDRLSEYAGVSARDLSERKLKENDLRLKGEKVERAESAVNESQAVDYGKSNLTEALRIISDLTYNNKVLVEAQLILANKINSSGISSASSADQGKEIPGRRDIEYLPIGGKKPEQKNVGVKRRKGILKRADT